MEAAWLKEGRQEDDWLIWVTMSVLSLTPWENGIDVKNKQATDQTEKQADDWLYIFFIKLINNLNVCVNEDSSKKALKGLK